MDIDKLINDKNGQGTDDTVNEDEGGNQGGEGWTNDADGFETSENTEENAPELPVKPRKRGIKKLKPFAVIAVILAASVAGIIVFKKFVQTKPVIPPAPVKTSIFQGEPSLLLKAESKAAPKVKAPAAAKANQTAQGVPLAIKPVKTVATTSAVPLPPSAPAAKLAVSKANNLNDLFKLKTATKTPIKAVIPQVSGESFPGQVPPPNFDGIPPNVLQNIKSKINGGLKNTAPSGPRVIGVSNDFAVVQYNGADLYLKPGDSFGNCTVLNINYNNVKISCGKAAKSYPVEFGTVKEVK